MVEKPILSPNFTIDDIHELREYNYEMTKHMTLEEKMDYYNSKGREVLKELEKRKSGNSVGKISLTNESDSSRITFNEKSACNDSYKRRNRR